MPVSKIPYDRLQSLIEANLSKEEWEKTQALINELKLAKKRKYLEKSELEKICRWKSPRAIRKIELNSARKIESVTLKAFKTRSEKEKIELLTSLNGVSVPMASSILMLLNPNKYGVIDIRVWEILYKMGTMTTNPKGVNFKWNEWYRYLIILRYFAKKFNVKARDIERTIFNVHKQFQKGKLYSNLTNNRKNKKN